MFCYSETTTRKSFVLCIYVHNRLIEEEINQWNFRCIEIHTMSNNIATQQSGENIT